MINIETTVQDKAFGSVLGAFLGDSIGSFLEFISYPNEVAVEKALLMPGQGPFCLSPGQLTDDSEMAMSLAKALAETGGKFSCDHIAQRYINWYKFKILKNCRIESFPFDCGATIGSAFPGCICKKHCNVSEEIIQLSSKINTKSESNGAIMKITPLAIWCSNLQLKDLITVVQLEVSLTHPSKVVQQAAVIYCYAIKLLLNNNGNMAETYQIIDNYIKTDVGILDKIKSWWEIVEKGKLMPGSPQIGWIKIAWTYAFTFLKLQKTNYLEIQKQVLLKGGDTDTNACIVGGLIGAAIGFKNLPKQQVEILLNCDCTQSSQRREEFYSPKSIIPLLQTIIKIAPKKLEFFLFENEQKSKLIEEEEKLNDNGFENLFNEEADDQQKFYQQKKVKIEEKLKPTEEQNKAPVCYKCQALNPKIIFRNSLTCNQCFEILITSKFKSALRHKLDLLTTKQKAPNNFYVCLSGGQNSLALVKMVSDTIYGNSQKKMFLNAKIIHIDESVLLQLAPGEAEQRILKLKEFCNEQKLFAFIIILFTKDLSLLYQKLKTFLLQKVTIY